MKHAQTCQHVVRTLDFENWEIHEKEVWCIQYLIRMTNCIKAKMPCNNMLGFLCWAWQPPSCDPCFCYQVALLSFQSLLFAIVNDWLQICSETWFPKRCFLITVTQSSFLTQANKTTTTNLIFHISNHRMFLNQLTVCSCSIFCIPELLLLHTLSSAQVVTL